MTDNSADRLILEYNFNSHQKTHLTFVGLAIIVVASGVFRDLENPYFWVKLLGLFILLISVVILIFSKNGLINNNGKIFLGYFIGKILLYKKAIDLTDKNALAVLKLKKTQKLAFFTSANPDWSQSFGTFDIALLNSKHTKKDILISLNSQENADKATDFLTKYTDLNLEVYSPDFS